MPPIVEIRDLVKDFGAKRAVDGLSLAVEEGEIFGLLGPNGAGKTTTIRVLTTLLAPTNGSAAVCGFDVVNQANEVRRCIGYVMQEVAQDYMLTGREHLELQASMYHLPPRSIRQRVQEVIDLVELTDAADGLARYYSGGMKKRLDLATGLIHNPRVLILDEPSLGLDVQSRHRVWEHIESLRRGGITALLATNYLDEADRMCDRLVIIDAGRVIAEGTPEALKASVGADVVSLDCDAGADLLRGAVAKLPPVKQSLITDGRLQVYVEDAASALPQLIHVADELGVRLAAVSYKRPSLDDVFLLHTGHQLRQEA
jgi:ABC-2 type transport system ATP-binding protein